MSKLIVKNGTVFDPINSVEGEEKDILVQDGKVVEKFASESDVKEIDAKNKIIIPAAVDIHAHLSSQQLNWARLLGSKNATFQATWKGLTLVKMATDYISNGYTFVVEANTYPSYAKQTVFELKNLPVLDKAMLLNVSSLWPLELEFQKSNAEEASFFLADLLSKIKAFGLKAYNPFESESWNYQVLRSDLGEQGRLYNYSALDVYELLTRANEILGLPHSVHAHVEGYELQQSKKNLSAIINKIKSLELDPNPKNNLKHKRSQIFHLAHISSYNFDGKNEDLIKFFNDNPKFDADLGFIGFDAINPLVTSDRRLVNSYVPMEGSSNPLIARSAMEFEGDGFALLRSFDKKSFKDCVLWANAIELGLNIKNKWQLQFSVNFPNYSSISKAAEIASWLFSKPARDSFMESMNQEFLKQTPLTSEEKVLSFSDYVIMTRASPAKSLGIGSIKGNLGLDADGDFNILNLNAKDIHMNVDHAKIEDALTNIEYVIKAGKVVKHDDTIDLSSSGQIFCSEGKVPKGDRKLALAKKGEFYQKFYSIFYDSLKTSAPESAFRTIN